MLAHMSKKGAVLVGGLLLVAFGFVLGTTVINTTAAPISAPILQQSTTTRAPLTEDERYFADIYNRVSASVVSINVIGSNDDVGVFGASGTGFVIDQQGHIITNNHVVDGADQIEVNFLDGTITEGTVVGLDPDSDIAVLQVNAPADELIPVTFGDSDTLFIGETTLAIGSPFGQRWTLTTGIISALGRTIQGLNQFSVGSVIQTDAAINPGNSGGPLLNLNGEVIGVNSQIASESRASAGIGFAIPSNLVKKVATDLITNGKVNYSFLGISSGSEMSLTLINALELPNNLQGVIVNDVNAEGPAGQAGLRPPGNERVLNGERVPTSADIITAIDGQPITGMSGLVSYLASRTIPGQTVNLSVWRDGQEIIIPVTLGQRPN
jgi:S1-C subfamily serine protease